MLRVSNRWEGKPISFAEEVKSELASIMPARPCDQLHELLGIFQSTRGRLIRGSEEGRSAYFSLLRNVVARKVVRLGRSLAHTEAKYHASRAGKRASYFIELPLPPKLIPVFETAIRSLPENVCDRKAWLRGYFLGAGSVNAPMTRYHLEITATVGTHAEVLEKMLLDIGIHAAITWRGTQSLVYIKEAEGISRCLSYMGASRAVMDFESSRVMRDVSNNVNRRLNLETANIDRTVGTGLRQVAAIDRLDEAHRLQRLPRGLQEMAKWRRAHPELNLNELASRMGLSKSAVNHRLRRLQELADSIPDHSRTRTA